MSVSRDYEQASQRYAEVLAEKEQGARPAGSSHLRIGWPEQNALGRILAQRETELAGLRAMLPSDRGTDERRLVEEVRRLRRAGRIDASAGRR